MEPDRATPPGEALASWQLLARVVLATAVVAFGLWILHEFLAALAWFGASYYLLRTMKLPAKKKRF